MLSSLLLGVVQGLLLVGDLLLVLSVLLVPVGGVTEAVTHIGVHGGGANLIFTLQHVKLARIQIDLALLLREALAPLFPRCLFGGLIGSGLGGRLRLSSVVEVPGFASAPGFGSPVAGVKGSACFA